MPTIDASGTTVSYTTMGEGPGLVFVAGTGLSAELNYGHLAGEFKESRTVVLADYAGSGQSDDPDGPLTVEMLAGQIAAAATAATADGEPVDVVGFSLGAVVAAGVAALHPELVRRLVLVAGWPDPDDARHRLAFDLWQGLERTDHDLFARFLMLTCFGQPFLSGLGTEGVTALLEGMAPVSAGMRAHMELDLVADIRDLLPRIAAPTLVIGLTRDHVVPVERARLLHDGIAGSEYAEIDTGHMVMFEKPAEFVEVCRRFLG
jgi:pimeloyl-ACP methyl ester carboxylesterase